MNTELRNTLQRASIVIGQAYGLIRQADDAQATARKAPVADAATSGLGCLLDIGVVAGGAVLMFILGAHLATRLGLLPLPDWAIILYLAVGVIGIPVVVAWQLHLHLISPAHDSNEEARKSAETAEGDLRARAAELLSRNRAVLAAIPPEYCYPDAVQHMLHDVETGRADTMKEALDRYDEHLHRLKTEAAFAALLAEQQRQTRLMKDILTVARLNTAVTIYDAWWN